MKPRSRHGDTALASSRVVAVDRGHGHQLLHVADEAADVFANKHAGDVLGPGRIPTGHV
jgi:hypothetical protein